MWEYNCNQTSLSRTARQQQRSVQGKPIDLESPLQLILRLKGIILVLQISLVTLTMHETYVCAPDHSKNISTNRLWNAVKTHAVVVYDMRALAVNILLLFSNQFQIYLLIRLTFVSSEVLSDINSLVLSTAFFLRFAFASSKESCGSSLAKFLNFSQLFVGGYGISLV